MCIRTVATPRPRPFRSSSPAGDPESATSSASGSRGSGDLEAAAHDRGVRVADEAVVPFLSLRRSFSRSVNGTLVSTPARSDGVVIPATAAHDSRLPSDRAWSQPSADERAIHRDEELRTEAEEGESPLLSATRTPRSCTAASRSPEPRLPEGGDALSPSPAGLLLREGAQKTGGSPRCECASAAPTIARQPMESRPRGSLERRPAMKNLIRRKDTRTVRFTRLAASAIAVAAVVAGAAAIATEQGMPPPRTTPSRPRSRTRRKVQAPQAQARAADGRGDRS